MEQKLLIQLYEVDKLSMNQIAQKCSISAHKVEYWLKKYDISRRDKSDATYQRKHPNGDPFIVKSVLTLEDALLYGMGIGLYWGEGTKANKYSVRLGNSDARLIRLFMDFLVTLYGVKVKDMRFGLQLFKNMNIDEAKEYWINALGISHAQLYKVIVTPSSKIGTYKHKAYYGVMTLYYNNKKLRDIIVNALPR